MWTFFVICVEFKHSLFLKPEILKHLAYSIHHKELKCYTVISSSAVQTCTVCSIR